MATARSQNGYSANDRSVIATYTIPGSTRRIALRKGDTSVILLDLLAWIHANIEPLDVGVLDDWGYAERTIRGSSTTLSNHASGTAADTNATKHPLAAPGTWTAEQKRRINAHLAFYEGCVRWGENYTGRLDGMHFEINRGATDCRRVADKIRAGTTPVPVEDDMTPAQAAQLDLLVTQLVTGPDPKAWGWPAFPGGSGDRFTVVDYLRKQNQRAEDTVREIAVLRTAVADLAKQAPAPPAPGAAPQPGPRSLTDADKDDIAARVVALLGAKTSA